jgi:hypothetical protein
LGILANLTDRLRKVLKLREIDLKKGSVADSLMRSIKYILLYLIFFYSVTASELFLKTINPVNIADKISGSDLSIWLTSIAAYVVLVSALFIKRFWCRYICPLGAAINILNYFYSSVALFLLFIFAKGAGIKVEWSLFLAGSCVIGYLYEVFSAMENETVIKHSAAKGFDRAKRSYASFAENTPFPLSFDVPAINIAKNGLKFDASFINTRIPAAIAINKKEKQPAFFPVIVIILILSMAIYIGTRSDISTNRYYYSKAADK